MITCKRKSYQGIKFDIICRLIFLNEIFVNTLHAIKESYHHNISQKRRQQKLKK